MGMADDMRNLAQEIVSSFDAREATRAALRQRVAVLRQETAAMLNGFRRQMKNIQHELSQKAADLKRFLGQAAASRRGAFRATLQEVRAGQEARSQHVRGMLSGCQRERKAATSHWQTMASAMAKRRASAAR